jgi:two-component system chemotaxis sensor kinase CheA
MDDLLTEFLAEAAEHIDAASMELVRIEKDPGNPALIASLFRHVHTIKGSSGFLSLPRVGRLAHGAEALIGRLRDGAKASGRSTAPGSRARETSMCCPMKVGCCRSFERRTT